MTWVSNRLKLWKQHRAGQRQKATERIAHTLYQRRVQLNRHGGQHSDWAAAERIVRNPLRKVLFSINGTLINTEKCIVEPISHHLRDSALFDIVDRISPALEAIGVLLIPWVLYLATQSYERQREFQANERLQQESVQNYINQLSEILLNVDGDLRSPENQRIRTIATASTFTLLNDPILNGARKGQIIGFLSQMELVQGLENSDGNLEPGAIISLFRADLNNADLNGADLNGANLRVADIVNASLNVADLSRADLSFTNLSEANLFGADLNNANLFGANLREANLHFASLNNANLDAANLSRADLSRADLSDAQNWTDAQLSKSILCQTKLPKGSNLDPNRDCPK